MPERTYPPVRFCEETGCVHYNQIQRLETALAGDLEKNIREKYERDLGIVRVTCEQHCERTAVQFYDWLRR